MWLRHLLIASAWAGFSTYSMACPNEKPESAVFDILQSGAASERIGTAFLVDARRGLFITALHNLAGQTSSLVLSRGTFSFAFDRVSSGNNAISLYDDWALLRAKDIDPEQGLFPLPDIPLVYDSSSASDFAGGRIIGSSSALRSIDSVDMVGSGGGTGLCDMSQIVMVQVPSYDKGYSGAPVYSERSCGVSAIASRFELPKDASTNTQQKLVALFQEYTQKIAEEGQNDATAAKIDASLDCGILREILKDKVFVKLVPAKCILNAIVVEASNDSNALSRSVVIEDRRDLVRATANVIRNLDTDDAVSVANISGEVRNAPWRWIDLLQVSDVFYSRIFENTFREGKFIQMLAGEFHRKQEALFYKEMDPFYRELMRRKTKAIDIDYETTGVGDVIDTFRAENVSWSPAEERPNLGLNADSAVSIAQGREPSPPAVDTATARSASWAPAIGAWMIGTSISRRSRSRLVGHVRLIMR